MVRGSALFFGLESGETPLLVLNTVARGTEGCMMPTRAPHELGRVSWDSGARPVSAPPLPRRRAGRGPTPGLCRERLGRRGEGCVPRSGSEVGFQVAHSDVTSPPGASWPLSQHGL